jgi:hypothetical protein
MRELRLANGAAIDNDEDQVSRHNSIQRRLHLIRRAVDAWNNDPVQAPEAVAERNRIVAAVHNRQQELDQEEHDLIEERTRRFDDLNL